MMMLIGTPTPSKSWLSVMMKMMLVRVMVTVMLKLLLSPGHRCHHQQSTRKLSLDPQVLLLTWRNPSPMLALMLLRSVSQPSGPALGVWLPCGVLWFGIYQLTPTALKTNMGIISWVPERTELARRRSSATLGNSSLGGATFQNISLRNESVFIHYVAQDFFVIV